MKVGQIGPTFLVPEKTVNFFGVKHVVPSSTLKMRKSHKKLARVYAYTHAYTQIRDGGGKSAPPPSRIGLRGFGWYLDQMWALLQATEETLLYNYI